MTEMGSMPSSKSCSSSVTSSRHCSRTSRPAYVLFRNGVCVSVRVLVRIV
jgi:hypothetical protein